jgi:hypothetical protein
VLLSDMPVPKVSIHAILVVTIDFILIGELRSHYAIVDQLTRLLLIQTKMSSVVVSIPDFSMLIGKPRIVS